MKTLYYISLALFFLYLGVLFFLGMPLAQNVA